MADWASSNPTPANGIPAAEPLRHWRRNTPRSDSSPILPLPVMTTRRSARRWARCRKPKTARDAPGLRHAVQVETGRRFLAAPRQMRPLAAADRRQWRRHGFAGATIRCGAIGRGEAGDFFTTLVSASAGAGDNFETRRLRSGLTVATLYSTRSSSLRPLLRRAAPAIRESNRPPVLLERWR